MSDLQPTSSTPHDVAPAAGWYDEPGEPGSLRYWNGAAWTERHVPAVPARVAPAPFYRKTSHGLHLALSILTLGLWIPVWIVVAGYNKAQNDREYFAAKNNR